MQKNTTNTIVVFNILSTLILQGLTFFTAPIISRMLGTDNYGIASVYITWVSLASTILGIQTQSTLANARKEYPISEQNQYQSSVFSLSLITFFGIGFIIIILQKPILNLTNMDISMLHVLLLHSLGQFSVTFLNTKFTYEFKAKQNFFLTTGITSSSLILSLFLIKIMPENLNYWGRILGLAIPYSFSAVLVTIYLLVKGRTVFNKGYWGFCVSLCIPIVFHNLSNIVLNQSDRVMIQNMMGNSAAGVYSLAYSFGSVLSAIWTALNNSWVPFYYEYSRQKQYEKMMTKAKNYTELFTVLSLGFILLAPEVFRLFASTEYWNGMDLLPIFAIGFFFMFMYSFPVNYEFYHKKTKLIAMGTIISAILNIILNFVLIMYMGILGAAIATALSYGVQYVFHHICASKMIKPEKGEKYFFKITFFLPYLCIFIVTVILWYFIQPFFLIRWSVAIVLGLFELHQMYKRRTIF